MILVFIFFLGVFASVNDEPVIRLAMAVAATFFTMDVWNIGKRMFK